MNSTDIIHDLELAGNPEKARHLSRFFKTGKGEYGEGDLFLGVTVPEQRNIARKYHQASPEILKELITSPWHECRLTALFILVYQFEHRKTKEEQKRCIDFYISHTDYINNWDLVDLSCYKILGKWLADKDRSLLYDWACCGHLWKQRIAMVSCMHFIRQGDFCDGLSIADILLQHPHDLIQKAVGWLLREIGKKDKQTLTAFLANRYTSMPRTALRYAIEHFPEEERKNYLSRTSVRSKESLHKKCKRGNSKE